MLVRLIYISYANSVMSEEEIQAILEKSKINNASKQITGLLMYSERYFFQCLEGERRVVNQTYLKICGDTRHTRCVLIDFSQVDSRLFPSWEMNFVAFNGVNNQMVRKYSENGLFQPYDFSASQAIDFLREVARQVQLDASEKPKSLLSWFKS